MDVKAFLAYAHLTYWMAAILYLIGAKCIGSPYKDALNRLPAVHRLPLLEARTKSTRARGALFAGTVVVSVLILFIWRPFR